MCKGNIEFVFGRKVGNRRKERWSGELGERVCLEPESNQRHADFQSAALPTELSRQIIAGIYQLRDGTMVRKLIQGVWGRTNGKVNTAAGL